jgi:hypothetical protein
MAGDFPVINPHLIKDLIAQGLWSLDMKHKIMVCVCKCVCVCVCMCVSVCLCVCVYV